jgi:puromycin-sensitive aminopeptidase
LNCQRLVHVKQQRFAYSDSESEQNVCWPVPIKVVSKSNIVTQALIDENNVEMTILVNGVSENDWIKLNVNSMGFYRIKYEPKSLYRLVEPIMNKTLNPQDRLMIQDDLAALCNAGHASFVDYLKLLPFYKNEDDFSVWKSICEYIERMHM